tara:strand:- start:9351 stop:9914 length:564 start_codon:yes stop_codon:yes gene_type:complete
LSLEAITWAFRQKLTPSEKLVLLTLADYADDENKCWPKQETLAERTGLARQTVNIKLSSLEKQGLINRESRRHTSNMTYLNVVNEKPKQKPKPKPKPKTKKQVAPTLDEVREYAKSRNVESLASQFYEYFSTGNWVDSRGNKVINWKQKFITWEKYNDRSTQTSGRNSGTFAGAADYGSAVVKAGNG